MAAVTPAALFAFRCHAMAGPLSLLGLSVCERLTLSICPSWRRRQVREEEAVMQRKRGRKSEEGEGY